jgi:Immunity protein Imm1
MTLAASWEMAPVDGSRWSESMEINTATDVTTLLTRLSTPPSDDAYLDDLRHADRADSPVVKLAVRQGWVYLRWLDDEFDGVPAGDERSPVAHGGHEPEYRAGTGISLEQGAEVLTRWLVTGRRPDVVTWVDLDDLRL